MSKKAKIVLIVVVVIMLAVACQPYRSYPEQYINEGTIVGFYAISHPRDGVQYQMYRVEDMGNDCYLIVGDSNSAVDCPPPATLPKEDWVSDISIIADRPLNTEAELQRVQDKGHVCYLTLTRKSVDISCPK